MDQCSDPARHPISATGDPTNRPGHDLQLGLDPHSRFSECSPASGSVISLPRQGPKSRQRRADRFPSGSPDRTPGHRRDLGFPKLSHIGARTVAWELLHFRRCAAFRPRREMRRCGRVGKPLQDSSFPEFTRITPQEVDDLVADRSAWVADDEISGVKEQQFRAPRRRRASNFGLAKRMVQVRFGAFAADNVGCVSSRERVHSRPLCFRGGIGWRT